MYKKIKCVIVSSENSIFLNITNRLNMSLNYPIVQQINYKQMKITAHLTANKFV